MAYPTRSMLTELRKAGWKIKGVYAYQPGQAKQAFYSLRRAWVIYQKETHEQDKTD